MKIMEQIILNHWVNGSGYSFSETLAENELEMTEDELNAEMPWKLMELDECNFPEDGDIEIVANYYEQDEDGEFDCDHPIRTESIWLSEILDDEEEE